ncbi:hypothetical protein CEP52_005599 [Fusarium oligoseptatum]|uniref:Uncharacterized protein n=1 Tax=Fusarium oligoseptatum TaxID=2604345 RepID=A0A428TXC0_9HYPO|nr:hypothetical protein CEP52_005599 [Fusarium oligoseptatum]
MGAVESKQPRSPSAKRRGGQGQKRGVDTSRQLIEIPFDLNAFLQAKEAQFDTTAPEEDTAVVSNPTEAEAGDNAASNTSQPQEQEQEPNATQETPIQSPPTVQTHVKAVNRVFRNADWSSPLQQFLTDLKLGTNDVHVIYESDVEKAGVKLPEELKARNSLSSPAKFSAHVHKFLYRQSRAALSDDMRHLYFLYHPDAEWHPDFCDFAQDKPLPDNFLGFSDDLDALVAWMMFIRQNLGRRSDTTMFHLLIPTWRPLFINDALEFPDLGALTIHGETHSSNNFVWFNLPTLENYPGNLLLQDVENVTREESEWKTAATVGTAVGSISASLAGTFALSVAFPLLTPLALVGALSAGGACSTIATTQVNKGLSREVPRVLGGFEASKEPAVPEIETGKEESMASEQEDVKEETKEETKDDLVKSKGDKTKSKNDQAKEAKEAKGPVEVQPEAKATSGKKHRRNERKRSSKS